MDAVDHPSYDTGSVLRPITHRLGQDTLPSPAARDAVPKANGAQAMSDLPTALKSN